MQTKRNEASCQLSEVSAFFFALGLCLATAAVAQTDNQNAKLPAGVTACAFRAITNDPDPNGPNIRQAPNASSQILGNLPQTKGPADMGKILPEFDVVGVQDGWFLIQGAYYDQGYFDTDKPTKLPKLYAGRGWVAGNLITTGLRTMTLKKAPDDNAEDVVALSGELNGSGFGPDTVAISKILNCSGPWFYVEVPLSAPYYRLSPKLPSDGPKGTTRGWTKGFCTAQLTTCV
jgi:hypothetical protein